MKILFAAVASLVLALPAAADVHGFTDGAFGAVGAGPTYYHTLDGVEWTATQIVQPDGIIESGWPNSGILESVYVIGQSWRRGSPETFVAYFGSSQPSLVFVKWNCAPPYDPCPLDGGGTTTSNGDAVFTRPLSSTSQYLYDYVDAGGHRVKALSYKVKIVEQGGPVADALVLGPVRIDAAAPSGGKQVFRRMDAGDFTADGYQAGWLAITRYYFGANNRENATIFAVGTDTITLNDDAGVPPGELETGTGDEVFIAGPAGTWRQSTELWDRTANGGLGGWVEVYVHTFDSPKHSCAHPTDPCRGGDWLAAIEIETYPCTEPCPMPNIREVGFENVTIQHDAGTDLIDSPGTSFRIDDVGGITDEWGFAHRKGNHTYGIGTYFEPTRLRSCE